ncbi:MAG: hypothetical protein IPI67_18985 [Myxococcales bacterium]|nr:hypothetical protein [Myxococcales bacterium]
MQQNAPALPFTPSRLPGHFTLAAATQAAPLSTSTNPDDRSTEFVAVQGGRESTSAGTLLVAAYLVIWALLFGFLYMGWRRSQVIQARLEGLEKALEAHEAEQP